MVFIQVIINKKTKGGAYKINLFKHTSIETHWIALYANNNNNNDDNNNNNSNNNNNINNNW